MTDTGVADTFVVVAPAIPLCVGVELAPQDAREIARHARDLTAYLHPDSGRELPGNEAALYLSLARLCERLARTTPLSDPEHAAKFMMRIGEASEVTMAEAWLFCIFVLCVDSVPHSVPNQPIAVLTSICRCMTTSRRTFISPDTLLDREYEYPPK